MAPSQLRRLKMSLRDKGVVGPQKSKKQKKQASKTGALKDSRIQRNAALQGIREQFNPFEVKTQPKTKYEFATNRVAGGRAGNGAVLRPGVTKGLGEETRRKTLLVEMQRRKKIGGITDKRFGENDPTMAPEDKALERFVKEKQRGSKRESLFDLEDFEEDEELTHSGQALSFNTAARPDDFDEADLRGGSDQAEFDELVDTRPRKKRRLSESDASSECSLDKEADGKPEQRRSKKEVMEEVIAKSKLYKYERQQAKEDDDDLRAELDKGLPDILAAVRGIPRQPPPQQPSGLGINPDRLALLNGKDRSQADMEYDQRLRQMALDQRAKPTVRTLTDKEMLQQEAQRLKELEEGRLRRMRGETEDVGSDSEIQVSASNRDEDPEDERDDNFGLGSGLAGERKNEDLGVEDEDDFLIEDDLIASGSDLDTLDMDESNHPSSQASEADDDDEFVRGLLSKEDIGREGMGMLEKGSSASMANSMNTNIAYTFKCPESHEEFLGITQTFPVEGLPTVIQRIRALYHPKLSEGNKEKLERFATILVDHLSFLANQAEQPPSEVLQALIRHIHSLAKSFPAEIGRAFRSHLRALHEDRSCALTTGDLMILTAIVSIFPTSDHFHQVVTPAMLCMTRYLGQHIPHTLSDLATGTYIVTICVQYQEFSKRYIPEVVNYILNALMALSPTKPKHCSASFPHHELPHAMRLQNTSVTEGDIPRLRFSDTKPKIGVANDQSLKLALLHSHIALTNHLIDLWADKSAFCEIFDPFLTVLRFFASKNCSERLSDELKDIILQTYANVHEQLLHSLAARKPLRLHNHRPLAIKTSIPKFEDSYNPDKHYDPDRDRADTSKLKAEHKRERKGALRELRKDANFIARVSLKEKKERDTAYEKKYKRLVAEIQGEEGHEAKAYEREKRMRKSKR